MRLGWKLKKKIIEIKYWWACRSMVELLTINPKVLDEDQWYHVTVVCRRRSNGEIDVQDVTFTKTGRMVG